MAVFVALIGFTGLAALEGARVAAARFGAAGRFAAFFAVFARLAVVRVGFAAAPFFRPAFLDIFRDAAPAERRPVALPELRVGRLARPPVGRFLAMSV